jgi:hypothetical protein
MMCAQAIGWTRVEGDREQKKPIKRSLSKPQKLQPLQARIATGLRRNGRC